MNGPTIWRLPCGSARRTENPSPRSRTRGTMTSSSASQDRLSPSTGSVEGIQLMAVLRLLHPRLGCVQQTQSPFIPAQRGIRGCGPLLWLPARVYPHESGVGTIRDWSITQISPLLDERAVVQLGERLLKLGLGVHHDRPVPRNRFLDRFAGDQQEADSLFAGLHRHLIAAVEDDERPI